MRILDTLLRGGKHIKNKYLQPRKDINTELVFFYHGFNRNPSLAYLNNLYKTESAFRQSLDTFDELAKNHFNYDVKYLVIEKDMNNDPWFTAERVHKNIIIKYCITDMLESKGITASSTLGFCSGGYNALYAAKALDKYNALKASMVLLKLLMDIKPDSTLVVCSANDEKINKYRSKIPHLFYISQISENVYSYAVPSKYVHLLTEYFSKDNIKILNQKTFQSWHTPFAEKYRADWQAELKDLIMLPLEKTYYSTVYDRMFERGARIPTDYIFELIAKPMKTDTIQKFLEKNSSNKLLVEIGRYRFPNETHVLGLNFIAPQTREMEFRTDYLVEELKNRKYTFKPVIEVANLDIQGPAFAEHPKETYEQLRLQGNHHFLHQNNCWLILDYDTSCKILKDSITFQSIGEAQSLGNNFLLGEDGETHTLHRKTLYPIFDSKRLQALRPKIWSVLKEELLALPQEESIDIVSTYCSLIPLLGVSIFLELNEEETQSLKDIATEKDQYKQFTKITELSQQIVQYRAKANHDDILSIVLFGDELSEADRVDAVKLLIIAGSVTGKTFLSNCLHFYLEDKKRLSNTEHISTFIEEVLRVSPPSQLSWRKASEAVQLSENTTIKPGDTVCVSLVAANHDPSYWRSPHTFDAQRQPNRHLAFAAGPHYCIGVMVARIEATCFMEIILNHFPNVRKLQPDELVQFREVRMRSFEHLEIILGGYHE